MSGKAESRLVYSSISMSERVANLGVKGALLFTWLLTHCDSQGRMLGKPMVVKAEVVPFLEDITAEEVHGSLLKMADENLIYYYQDKKGRQLIQVVDWWEYQSKLKHMSASLYEAPDGWLDKLPQRDEQGRFTGSVP